MAALTVSASPVSAAPSSISPHNPCWKMRDRSAIGSTVSAPVCRASATCCVQSTSQLSSSHRSWATRPASHSQRSRSLRRQIVVAEGAHGPFQDRRRRGATVGHEQRQTVEEKVGRTRRRRLRRGRKRRLRHLDHVGAAGQATDDHGGGERLEIGFARQPDVERLELPCRLRAAAGERRASSSSQTRSGPAGGPRARGGARQTARPGPSRSARARPRGSPRRTWPGPRRAPARRGAPGRGSAARPPPGTQPLRPCLLGLAHGQPSAPTRRQRPRRVRWRRARGARRDGPDQASGSVTSARARCTS